jgi:serine protease
MGAHSARATVLAFASSAMLLWPAAAEAHGVTAPPHTGPAVASPGRVHYMPTLLGPLLGLVAPATSMSYHGGPVLAGPRIYLDFWGPEWQGGFRTCSPQGPCFTSGQIESYAIGLVSSWGGSPWRNTDTQYCSGVAFGAQSCGADVGIPHVTDPANQYGGAWTDPASVPGTPQQQDIANEGRNALSHFNPGAGSDPNGIYFVFTPPGKLVPGSGTDFCGYHSAYTYPDGSVQFSFAYQPFIFNNSACGMNFVNNGTDSFGHGFLDGLSMVIGHEVAESETDPGAGSAWTDSSGNSGENGDKCNFNSASANVAFGSNYYAMQPIWSNADTAGTPGGSCVMASASSLNDAQRFVNNAFVDVLGRPVDPNGLNYYSGLVFSGTPRTRIAAILDTSTEYLTHVASGLYQRYLKRGGDGPGINSWVYALSHGATDESEAVSFLASDEYFASHGGNNTSYVYGIYNDALGRAPDPGAAYWIARLDAGGSRVDAAAAFLYTDEVKTDIVNGYYQLFLRRYGEPDGVRYWVGRLQHGVTDEALISLLVSSPEYFYKS